MITSFTADTTFHGVKCTLKCASRKKAQEKKEDMIAMTRATVFCGLLGVASGYSFGVRSALSASRRMRGGITTVDSAARVPEGAV